MALDQSVLSELLAAFQSGEGLDLIRESVRLVCQELIETELSALIGAERYERTDDRTDERNGHRTRVLTTKAGDVELAIPKLRRGSFFPSILEPRRRIDLALYAVVMEAYVHGVSTRAVDDLVEAMGSKAGISKSEVSRICAGLDEAVGAFRGRRLDHGRFPYIWLDATYLHVRADHQVTSKAVVVATGVTEDGRREILGIEIGDSEDEAFWREFLRSLKRRGLTGVRLVISDQHAGLVAAIRRCFQGAGHQRCRVHFARNLLANIPKGHQEMVAAAFRTIFAQVSPEEISAQWDHVANMLTERFDKAAALMLRAKEEVLAFRTFPEPTGARSGAPIHWSASTRRSSAAAASSASFPTKKPPSDSAVPWCSTSTTSGPPPNGATSPKPLWQISTHRAMMTTRHPESSCPPSDRHRG